MTTPTPSSAELPVFCCVANWSEARQAAWKARNLKCGCDPTTSIVASATRPRPATNEVDEDGQAGLDEYDEVLAAIDSARSTGGSTA